MTEGVYKKCHHLFKEADGNKEKISAYLLAAWQVVGLGVSCLGIDDEKLCK